MRRIATSIRSVLHHIRGAARIAGDSRSFLQLALDALLYRVLGFTRGPAHATGTRTVRLRPDVCLAYRRNRGDIWSIREVWMDEAYRLPFPARPATLVDLGANIGLTSLWLARRYGCSTIVAVEPHSDNARLLRENLARNGLDATVLQAAVGPEQGYARFEIARDHTMGRLGSGGGRVSVVAMESLMERLPPGVDVDLLKVDIEGAEGALFAGDVSWLARVKAIVIELHHDLIEADDVIGALQDAGFRYIPAGQAHRDSMDAFVRAEPSDIRDG